MCLQGFLLKANLDHDHIVIISLLQCLSRCVPCLDRSTSKSHCSRLFWPIVTLAQVSTSHIFGASLDLLEAIVETMRSVGGFRHDAKPQKSIPGDDAGVLSAPFMRVCTSKSRMKNLEDLAKITGLSFKSSFSYSLVGSIMKVCVSV